MGDFLSASVEELLLSDQNHLHRKSVDVRRAAEARLRQMINHTNAALHIDTLSLVVSSEKPPLSLNFQHNDNGSLPFYVRFPYLFYELYPQVPLEQYDQLALSQHLYLSHGLMLDRLMDGKLLLEPQIAHWINSIYQEFLLILSELFPKDSPFWAYFEKCRIENTQALIAERLGHTYRIREYSDQEINFIFSGKSAVAKAGLAALAYLGKQDISDEIILSCDAFHIGFQFMDNLQDWRSDYRDHMYTPLLARVLLDHQLADKAESTQRPDVNVVGSLIYGGGYAQATLKSAADYFQLALYAIKDVKCPAWQSEILGLIQKCKQRQIYLDQKLYQMKEKRNLQTATTMAQAQTELDVQDVSVLSMASLQQMPETWIEAFCQSAGFTLDAIRGCSDPLGDSTNDWDSFWLENAQEILKRCRSFAPSPLGLQLYLCNVKKAPISFYFEYEQRWQVILNLAALSDDQNNQLQLCREHLVYQYGQISRLRHASKPKSLLDEMCIKGFGLVFVEKVLPELEQYLLLPIRTTWFERNKHYLWQEVQPYLKLPVSLDLATTVKRDNLDVLLSHDLITSYCERMGDQALLRGIDVNAEDIINKSTVLAVANCIAGETNVSFDL